MRKAEQTVNSGLKEPQRLVALSDGLFATVLTLLVLDLRIPDALVDQGGNIETFIKWIGPHLFSYLLTFFVAAVYWLAHHRDFDHVTGYDRTLLSYNLLFLLFVGLFPFSTAAIGLVGFDQTIYPFYWALYCANIILAGVLLTLTWLYAFTHGLVDADVTRLQSQHTVARHLLTPAVFLVSVVAEYLFPRAFLGPYALLLIPLVQTIVDRRYERAGPGFNEARRGWNEFFWRAGTILIWLLIIGLAVWASAL
ncbi:MAG TPA: TMEM175 family protein [Anaerolineales bacterium]|nr:TMEM175 family protein [Anaerolineales bacterium]